MALSEILGFPLEYGFGEWGSAEEQFADNERRMVEHLKRARDRLWEAGICFRMGEDGIFSDEEERAILARRGATSFTHWAQNWSDRLGVEWSQPNSWGGENFVIGNTDDQAAALRILFESVLQHLVKTLDEFEAEAPNEPDT